jgi:hypothetical protein
MPTAAQDLDLIVTTLENLGEDHWTDLLSTQTGYIFLENIFKKERLDFQAGESIRTNVAVTPSTSFEMVDLLGVTDNVNIVNHFTNFSVQWRRSRSNWAVDAPEMSMNRGRNRIFDLVKGRRSAMWINNAEGIELQGWSQPTDSNDTKNINGIPAWVIPNATAAGSLGGFNGLNTFGFTTGLGLDSTKFPRFANYTDSYATVDKLDLILKMRRAARLTDFKSPVEAAVPTYAKGVRRGIYVDEFTINNLELACEAQNDNLGSDLNSKGGSVTFNRTPLTYVPKLNDLMGTGAAGATGKFVNATYATSGGMPVHGVYMLDWGVMQVVFLSGWYAREDGPYQVPGQRTTYATQLHWIWNVICRDRRRQSCITM